jgi:predicted ATPase/DNA-binding CsgD family transcriptional regulator
VRCTMARPAHRPGNLPAEVTSFIGRRRELAGVRRALTGARLVSLTGPGGVGKTRLAVRAAAGLGRGLPDGVWLVELADVAEPAQVANTVLAALDLRDQVATDPLALVLSYLRDRKLLLVVDNCEHLLGPVARLVAEVVRAAPGVRVLATSREPLSVPGEHVVPVPPLEEAVRLFADRAKAASGSFALTAANQPAVAELCRRLDGLPLAVELAAVRTRVLTVEQILERLTDRFGLLTGGGRAALPRHQTLRTTIDWSHDLLAPPEQALLRRLCVYAGRFALDDVEPVCAPAGPALDLLSSLVDKSLVMKEDADSRAAYRLHETMREYARLKLRAAGEQDAVELRCDEYYLSRCRLAAPDARYRLVDWLAWMDLEIDNIRAVLRRCLARHDIERGLELATSIGWYWITRATNEGVRWFDELLAAGSGQPRAYALAQFLRGFLAVLQSDPAAARPALDRAAKAAQRAGAASLRSQSLSMESVAATIAGDRDAARRLLEAAATDLDDYLAAIAILQARALGGLSERDLDTVRAAAAEGVRRSREAGDLYGLDMMLMNLGTAALVAGDLDEALPRLTEALGIARRIDDRVAQYYLLYALGCHAAGTGQHALAAELFGAASAVQTGVGASVLPHLAPLLLAAQASTRDRLGSAAYQARFAAGTRLRRDAAVGLALHEPAPGPAGGPDASPLRPREAQVATLIAEGLTNKQIGTRLLISEHTVDSHIRGIMNKLGVNSRAQIATWLTSRT